MKKRKSNVVYKFLAAIVVLLVGGGFFVPFAASADSETNCSGPRNGTEARICQGEHIVLDNHIFINGTEGNFVKVGPNDSFRVTVKLYLTSPPDLKVNTGYNSGADAIFTSGKIGNYEVTGFGATIVPQDTTKYCGNPNGYLKCQSDGNTTAGFFLSTSKGKFDDYKEYSSLTTLKAGDLVYEGSFTISSTDFDRLGIKNIKNDATGNEGLNMIYVYPDMTLSPSLKSNDWTTALAGGKSVYIQRYSASVPAGDTSSPSACTGSVSYGTSTPISCVPNYGSNTSSFNNTSDKPTGLVGFLVEIVTAIVFGIQWLIYQVFTHLISPLLVGVLSIRTYTDSFAAVIYPGWEVVRNLCNILFIVALIAIGLGTLFRLESYQYKHMLVEVIIAALLVNFSLLMAQAVLGLADTVQNQFLPNNSDVVNQLAYTLFVNAKVAFSAASFEQNGYFSNLAQPLFQLGFTLGSFVIFTFLAGLLVVRIVGLWVLLMISPVAYAAGALPSTAHYRSEWWKEFIKYAFFTPILAFFLNIAALLAQRMYDPQYSTLNQLTKDSNAFGGSTGSFVVSLTSNIMLIIFIIAGTKIADQFGVMGGDIMSKWAKGGAMLPFAAAKFGALAAGNKAKKEYDKFTSGFANAGKTPLSQWFARQAFKVAHPVNFVQSLREESKKERDLYSERVKSGAKEVARKQYGWRRKTESPMYIFDEHHGKELYEEEEGEWSDNEQQVIAIGRRLAHDAQKGDLRAQIKLKHWFTEAFRHRNLNEALEGDKGLAMEFLDHKVNYNSNGIRFFFQKMVEKGVLDKNFTQEFLKKLSKDGYETGDFNGVELIYAAEDGHPHMIEMEEVLNPDGSHTGDAMPKGWSHYVVERTRLIAQADADGRAEASAKLARGVPPEQVNVGVEIENKLRDLEDSISKHDHDYANSMHAERARRYMKINMSKKTGADQVRMFHDSLVNVGVIDGKVRISDAGTEVFGHMDANKMYAMGRDNMPAKTRDKFMRYVDRVVSNPAGPQAGLDVIESDLRQIIIDKYRENGEKLDYQHNAADAAKLNKEVAEQRNFWLASGYSILSSTPGATVMQKQFENVSKRIQAEQLVATGEMSAADVSQYVEGKIALPRRLNQAELQHAAELASEETKNSLINGIMNFKH